MKGSIWIKSSLDYTSAINLDPENDDLYFERAGVYAQLKQHELAISDLSRAIEINPNDHEYYYYRGISYALLKKYKDALNDLTSSLAINPNFGDAYYQRGTVQIELGYKEDALRDLDDAIEILSWDETHFLLPYAYSARGELNFEFGNYEKALLDYSELLKIAPQYTEGYLRRGIIYAVLGDYERAKADLLYGLEVIEDPEMKTEILKLLDDIENMP
ncbi:MAG: tetratricopeptide repeat protein [Anaerolineales bacterium]|nr:tetratricopeptide repeat protein [Anaerolineales bacterium]